MGPEGSITFKGEREGKVGGVSGASGDRTNKHTPYIDKAYKECMISKAPKTRLHEKGVPGRIRQD